MNPFHRCIPIFILLYSIVTPIGFSKSVDEYLDWPPVFERLIGTPEVVIKDKEKPVVRWVRPLKKIYILVPGRDCDHAKSLLIDYCLEKVWCEYLAESSRTKVESYFDMKEMIPLNRAKFFYIGRHHLAGRKTGCRISDTWWKVRMGYPLGNSCDHLLCFNNLAWSEKDLAHGHFCFALRKRGGAPDCDMIFDFRAPWTLDRRSQISDLFDDSFYLYSYHENFYDWLTTQTEFRHCDVQTTFVPVSEEQVILLKNYQGGIHCINKYKSFKGNCASLGLQFLNRILPLDQRIKREHSIVDYPAGKIKLAAASFGKIITEVEFKSTTLEKRAELSHRNATRPAKPSRERSAPYQKLLAEAVVN